MKIDKFNKVVRDYFSRQGENLDNYDDGGYIELSRSDRDKVYVECSEKGAVAVLGREYAELSSTQLIQLLQGCDHRVRSARNVYVGLNGDSEVMYLVRIDERNMNVPNLIAEFERLYELHELFANFDAVT
ncbi:MAG: hypothetical protein AB8B87_01325 [Granulosicoccus sp.]